MNFIVFIILYYLLIITYIEYDPNPPSEQPSPPAKPSERPLVSTWRHVMRAARHWSQRATGRNDGAKRCEGYAMNDMDYMNDATCVDTWTIRRMMYYIFTYFI